MPTQTKRAKTGFVGEFFIYSELIKRGKNCFITLGNAKSVDLILVDREKRAFFIDVKSSNTLMKNYHKHADYSEEMGLLARWQVSVKIFWECHPKNGHFEKRDLPDFYIFHSLQKPNRNIIVSGQELKAIMHRRIDEYLKSFGTNEMQKKHLCNWDICELCFEINQSNVWDKIPE